MLFTLISGRDSYPEDGHKLSKKKTYQLEEDAMEEPSTHKGRGVYCSLVTIVFTAGTVCVLITAAVLMAYFIPRSGTSQESTNGPNDRVQLLMKGRLPKTVLPRRYEVNLRPFLYQDDVVDSKLGKRFTFDGWVRITVECIQLTNEITLHSKSITIHGMPKVTSISTLDTTTNILDSYEMVEEYAFMVLKLKETLIPYQQYSIYMDYSGILGDDLAGFYPSKYLDPSNNTRLV